MFKFLAALHPLQFLVVQAKLFKIKKKKKKQIELTPQTQLNHAISALGKRALGATYCRKHIWKNNYSSNSAFYKSKRYKI